MSSLSLLLLIVALDRNSLSSTVFQEVNLSGSLRYRTVWIYGATHGGNADVRPQIAAMNGIRAHLRVRYPEEVAQTDNAWDRYTRLLQQTGQVDWDTANTMREAFNTLTQQIAQKMAAQNAAVAWFLWGGMLALLAPHGAILWLLKEMETTKEALRAGEMRFRMAVTAMEEGLVLQNQNGAILMCNASAERILGLTADQMIGRDSLDPRWCAVHEDGSDFPGAEHPAMLALRTGFAQNNVVMGIRKPTGELTWVSINAVPLFFPDEKHPHNVVVTFGDITERTRMGERFRVLFNHSSDAYMMFDERGIIDCNAATVTMLRCTDKSEVLRLHPAVLSPEFQPDGRRSDEKCQEMDALARTQGMHQFEWMHRKSDGEVFPVKVTLTAITLQDRPVLLVVWHDLTEHKIAEQKIRDLAVVLEYQNEALEKANTELASLAATDGLTGLKNHRFFQERLAEEISEASRYLSPLSVILLDVDEFKTFNDTFGHPSGDAVLRQIARVLQNESRGPDIIARYGGEEFVLVLPHTDAAGAMVIAERIRRAIEKTHWPLRPITASLGVASLSLECTTAADLVARADRAMYHSKAGGKNHVTCSSRIVERV